MSGPAEDFPARLLAWTEARPEIEALVLIGSHARESGDELRRADAHSDWDFHLITTDPQRFAARDWTQALGARQLLAYSFTTARIGGVPRVAAAFTDTAMDLIILPVAAAAAARAGAQAGTHLAPGPVRSALQDLAVIIRPGWRFLKRHAGWEQFYRDAVAWVPDPRLSNEEAIGLAESFVCAWISIRHKIDRGELVAAARLTQRELGETNLRLLHEIRLRGGLPSFPEGRRLERVATAAELAAQTVDLPVRAAELRSATQKSAHTLNGLMRALAGAAWSWPAALPIA